MLTLLLVPVYRHALRMQRGQCIAGVAASMLEYVVTSPSSPPAGSGQGALGSSPCAANRTLAWMTLLLLTITSPPIAVARGFVLRM